MKTKYNETTLIVAERQIKKLMEKYRLRPEMFAYFKQGIVSYSYITSDVIGIRDVSENNEYKSAIKLFEEKFNGYCVYYAIVSETSFGRLLSLLYVKDSKETKIHKDDLIDAYVVNLDDPECSEFGKIGICNYMNSGLLFRFW